MNNRPAGAACAIGRRFTANKFLLSLGWRHRTNGSFFTFAFTENLRNFNNTPDIGFQLSFGHTFR